jgi:hypothetical protein
MKCSYGRAVQWKDGDAELTGVIVQPVGGLWVSEMRGVLIDTPKPSRNEMVLVAHSYTRELEFVEFGKLSDYPASPIPQPGEMPEPKEPTK